MSKDINKNRRAALKSAETKGPIASRQRRILAAWTRVHGNDDARNPYSKEDVHGTTMRKAIKLLSTAEAAERNSRVRVSTRER